MKMEIRECPICGKRTRGPSHYRHVDSCRVAHGQPSGKIWRATFRRIARRSASLLRAMSKPPAEHQQDLFGPRKGPQDVIAALERAKTRKQLSWTMSWAAGWPHLLEKNAEQWPQAQRKAIWDRIWGIYLSRFGRLRGKAPLIDREKYGRRD